MTATAQTLRDLQFGDAVVVRFPGATHGRLGTFAGEHVEGDGRWFARVDGATRVAFGADIRPAAGTDYTADSWILRPLKIKPRAKITAHYAVVVDGRQIGRIMRTKRYGLWYAILPGQKGLGADFRTRQLAAKAVVEIASWTVEAF